MESIDRAIAISEKTESMDLKANPEEMESDSGHREIHKEDAVVKSDKGRKKRHRDRHLGAGRRGEPKELTRGDCGSRRKLAAACRKVSRRAAVARYKGNFGLREIVDRGRNWPPPPAGK